jgi:hypothetical protein
MKLRALALLLPLLSAATFTASGCDSAKDAPAEDPAKKAEEAPPAEDPLAKRKAEREAKAKAAEEAAAAEAAAIDALAVLPDVLPKKLDKACEERTKGEDDFMHKHYEGEALAKWESAKGTQLGFAKQGCVDAGSIEVAACQVNAMKNAPTELRKKLPDLLKRCMEKFGGKAP